MSKLNDIGMTSADKNGVSSALGEEETLIIQQKYVEVVRRIQTKPGVLEKETCAEILAMDISMLGKIILANRIGISVGSFITYGSGMPMMFCKPNENPFADMFESEVTDMPDEIEVEQKESWIRFKNDYLAACEKKDKDIMNKMEKLAAIAYVSNPHLFSEADIALFDIKTN